MESCLMLLAQQKHQWNKKKGASGVIKNQCGRLVVALKTLTIYCCNKIRIKQAFLIRI